MVSHGETSPGTHCIGDRVGPRAGLDAVEWRKNSFTCRELKIRYSIYISPSREPS
jgi:hypothetical protein